MDHLKLCRQFLRCKTAELAMIGLDHWKELTDEEKVAAYEVLQLAADREKVYYRRLTGSIKDVKRAEKKIRKAIKHYNRGNIHD